MSAWAEASSVVDDVTSIINTKSTSIVDDLTDVIESQGGSENKAVIIVTTTTASYIGKTCYAKLTNGFEQFQATFVNQGNGVGKAIIYVSYIGKYNIYVDNNSTSTCIVSELGEVIEKRHDAYVLYGWHCDGNLTDPAAKISYIAGTVNENYTPVQMNFETGIIDGGDWFDVDENGVYSNLPFFFPRSCMLSYAGKVSYYLDENDETKKEDGTASEVTNTSFGGNAMMEWGQDDKIIYTKWVPDSGDSASGSFYVCNTKLDSDFKDYAFRDKNNNLTSHFYTSKYFGSSDGTRMRSISGQSNYVNNTAASEISLARANGSDIWDTLTLAQWNLINGLLILMAKSTNTQVVYGRGRADTSSAIGQGTMNGKGMFYGSSSGSVGVKVFGMENWWGNLWKRIRGYINASGTIKIKLTRGTFDESTASDYNTDGSNYLTISDCTPSGTSGGYISTMKFTKYGMYAKVASGSETTHYTDGLWFNNSQSNYACVGGGWSNPGLVGALYVYLGDAPSYAYSNLGSALSCTPLAS